MKKRVIALLFAIMFGVSGMLVQEVNVLAEENVDIEDIWTEDALVGYSQSQTWGVYLARGISVINDAGGGKIGCGGVTEAAKKCKVGITSIVERQVSGSWVRVTSWTTTKESAYSASISKYLSVGSGYYYRVRSTHYAGTDGSSSYTSGMWM